LPLSEKARIEVYLPDLPKHVYQDLLDALEQEFSYTFGGCTLLRDLEGNYLSRLGLMMRDPINLLYTDALFAFEENLARISRGIGRPELFRSLRGVGSGNEILRYD
jgi:hypothetical protein